MTDLRLSSEAESRFLRVPLEIRRHIYRFLLLDPPRSFLSTPLYQETDRLRENNEGETTNDEMWHGTEYQGDFYEYNYNNSDLDMDYSYLDSLSKMRDAEANLSRGSTLQDGHKSVWKGDNDKFDVRRHTAILRTNRQIYNEASSLLYTELIMHLQPGDVLCMNTGKDIVKASERLWRHNPLHGIGTTNPSGQTVYAKPECHGVMEPHVLARFKKITFDMDFNWEFETLEAERYQQVTGDQPAPSLFVDENLTVNPEDEAKLLVFYQRSTIIHQLVKILSNSPDIFRLEIRFDIEVLGRYDMSLESDSEDEEEDEKTDRKMDVANERAMELFFDSGLLAPLEKLSNVRRFQFEFDALDCNGEIYKPTSKYGRMLRDLKLKIERNHAVRDD
ncbi:MAG: hypothetical protein ASARMPRED_000360 [Alectoria sarmentosa]|nr:MAG: hypothetical protein ASARMPRED_000360 [Alectoria sarmentosa]